MSRRHECPGSRVHARSQWRAPPDSHRLSSTPSLYVGASVHSRDAFARTESWASVPFAPHRHRVATRERAAPRRTRTVARFSPGGGLCEGGHRRAAGALVRRLRDRRRLARGDRRRAARHGYRPERDGRLGGDRRRMAPPLPADPRPRQRRAPAVGRPRRAASRHPGRDARRARGRRVRRRRPRAAGRCVAPAAGVAGRAGRPRAAAPQPHPGDALQRARRAADRPRAPQRARVRHDPLGRARGPLQAGSRHLPARGRAARAHASRCHDGRRAPRRPPRRPGVRARHRLRPPPARARRRARVAAAARGRDRHPRRGPRRPRRPARPA